MEKRNVAIIAHVDHGKTTLVDALLKQSGMFERNTSGERVMDRNDLEKERGITILSKCTSLLWNGSRINIVDTPGHADFGGEVERILGMVDGVILLVDSAEGPMPQTRFVTEKALSLGLRPIVIINKMDRPDKRPTEVHEEIFDLFVNLNATEEQLSFPTLYASSRAGWVSKEEGVVGTDVHILFETIMSHVLAPKGDLAGKPSVLATILENDAFLGRIITGRIHSGTLKVGDSMKALDRNGKLVEQARITKLMLFHGIEKIPVETVEMGDIVAVAGFTKATVSDTICSMDLEKPLPAREVDPPVLAMHFSVNDSPYAGKDGKKVTSRVIRERLFNEQEGNVSIKVKETGNTDTFEVAGRGELQLGILIETMRREGFELTIGRPKVLIREENGQKLEPIEQVQIDVDDAYTGTIMDSMNARKGTMTDMKPIGGGKTRMLFLVPTRGIIGYYSHFLTETRGTGIMSRIFHGYEAWKGDIEGRRNGVLISNGQGTSVPYALWYLEERGHLFIGGGVDVYEGMIIGEHSRDNDLDVNPLKTKQLTNVRASGNDEAVRLTPPRKMDLEQAIAYIDDDEVIEVTPKHIRLRKRYLSPNDRKKYSKASS